MLQKLSDVKLAFLYKEKLNEIPVFKKAQRISKTGCCVLSEPKCNPYLSQDPLRAKDFSSYRDRNVNVRKGTYWFQLMMQMAILSFFSLSLSPIWGWDWTRFSGYNMYFTHQKKKKGLKAATDSRDKHSFVTNKVAFKKGSFPILIAQIITN